MKETRKQLIEMLSDYMDKTLSDGCLIKHEDKIYTYWDVYYIETERWESFLYWTYDWRISYFEWYKILWHYDITAVLKYICNWWWDYNSSNDILYIDIETNVLWKWVVYHIPNKPLHLYSEDEEKDLLKLLKNLWKKN